MKFFKSLITLSAVILFSSNHTNAQYWQYSQHISTTHGAEIRGLTLDSDTNLYGTAFHKDDADLIGPHGVKTYATAGNQDILVFKLNPLGDTLWTRSIHGTHSDYPRQIELDNNENPYITGIYRRSPLTIQGTTLPTFDEFDIFLAKYTKDGGTAMSPRRVAWGPDDDRVDKIAVDNQNNIYMTGEFNTEVYFETDTLVASTESGRSVFLAKFNPNGDYIWSKEIIVTGSGNFLDIAISNDVNIYLSGYFVDTLIYNTDSVFSRGSAEDVVLAKIDSSGALQWMRTAGSLNGSDRANGLTTDPSGAIYLTGYFSGEADFGSQIITSAGSTDMFMAKYNITGDLIWVSRNGAAGPDIAYGAKVRENILLTTGAFSGSVNFSNTTVSTHSTTEQNPGFFVYNIDGDPITAQSLSTNVSNTNNRAEYIEYDLSGNTYIGGYFRADSLFIGNDTLVKSASSGGDPREGFMAKYINPFTAIFSEKEIVNCPGETNGLLAVTTYFGTGPYTYEWNHDAALDSPVAMDLEPGNYSVKITDAIGDTVRIFDTIFAPDTIKTTLLASDISCYAAKNGSISTTVTGGSSPYSYAWTGASGIKPAEKDQSGLATGWCWVTVSDNFGCEVKDSALISQPEIITAGPVTIVPEVPKDSYNGKIILDVKGGTPTYTYTWDSAGTIIGTNADSLVNRTQGYYSVEIEDTQGCIKDTTLLLLGETFHAQPIGTDISCYDANNGSAVVSVVAGADFPPYDFVWTDSLGNDITEADPTTITNLGPGWYFVTATDDMSNISLDSVYIAEPDTLEINFVTNSLACFGDDNGWISMSVSGGTPSFSYSWSNGEITESLSNLTAGNYIVTVTDNNGCVTVDSTELTENDSLIVDISLTKGLACFEDADGIITANTSGGTSPYNYIWNDPGSQTTAYAQNLDAGNYTVEVTDNAGCMRTVDYELIQPTLFEFTGLEVNAISCFNSNDGEALVSLSGGTKPYSFDWSDISLPDTNFVSGLRPGGYEVGIADANNCTLDTAIAFVIKAPAIEMTIEEDESAHIDNTCFGESIGSITVSVNGGWGKYEYSSNAFDWSPSNVFSDLSAAEYEIFVRDSNNCTESVLIDVLEPAKIIVSSVLVSNNIIISANGGTAPYMYQLNTQSTPQDSEQFSNLPDGQYWVDVTDVNNCGPVRSDTIDIDLTGITKNLVTEAKVYPNPSNGLFEIQLNPSADSEFIIEVYNIGGSLIKSEIQFAESKVETTIPFDLSDNPKGIYMISINGIMLPNKLVIE